MVVDFSDIKEIRKAGFVGFKSIHHYYNNPNEITDRPGVYLILLPSDFNKTFLENGTGGFFKGKNPNVSIPELENNWVTGTPVIYIGKATSLRKRLRQYFQFGNGKSVGHYGGRYIWQLSGAHDLHVCFLPTDNYDLETIESALIQDFRTQFNARPFANLTK